YPEIANTAVVGSARISEIQADGEGKLWMPTWRGILRFDPQAGIQSLTKFDSGNSPHPGGRTVDMDVAPDGTLWFAVFAVSWGSGGLLKYDPATDQWQFWGFGTTANNWPNGTISCEAVTVLPGTNDNYQVWTRSDNTLRVISYDSVTEQFTEHPRTGNPGELAQLPGNDCADEQGNLWMVRYASGSQFSLDYRRPDGSWVNSNSTVVNSISVFKAYGNGEALLVDGNSALWHYTGTSWQSLGIWRTGGFTYNVDVDTQGVIWICGKGGAARRDPQTGFFQRYRITNTGQFDFFNDDIALDPNSNRVYAAANAGPGTGGLTGFDGERWTGFNSANYGLGHDWPFLTDNCVAVTVRGSNGKVVVSPEGREIYEWDGLQFDSLQHTGTVMGLCEDSQGRLWRMGEYFAMGYHDGATWNGVNIIGFGNNVTPDPAREGSVWASAYGEVINTDGVNRFSRLYSDFPEINTQHDIFTNVAADPDGSAWLGSTNGLFHIDPDAGTYDYYGTTNSSIPGDLVRPFVVSPDGKVWFSNFNSDPPAVPGLCWFDGTEFGVMPVEAGGLRHAQIKDVELRPLSNGYELWIICTSRAIAVLTVTEPTVGIADEQVVPTDIHLDQNYPNPFNPTTTIAYELKQAGSVELSIFNALGQKVRTLVKANQNPGRFEVHWDGMNEAGAQVASGVYLYQLKSARGTQIRRMVLLK
nr:FlgD immunoglobulin-like domain containing protein [Calditrichia bacterium]